MRFGCVIEPLEKRRLLATTYYVSASGDDSNNGLSPQSAWRSIDRINQLDLNGGDKLLLEGGQTFSVGGVKGPNVLVNPSFEEGLLGWAETLGSNAANSSVVADPVKSGVAALKLSGSGAATRAQDVTASLVSGQTYEMSASSTGTNLGSGIRRVGITFYSGTKQVATFYRGFRSPVWSTHTWQFVAPPQFDRALVWMTRKGDSSSLYIDDLSLRSVPNGLVFDENDSGTAAEPVIIASYGAGKATIDARDSIGLWGGNVQGFRVQNLKFRGSWSAQGGSGENAGVGIDFVNTRDDNSKLHFVTVEKCDVRGFRWGGIRVGGWAAKSGFHTALITDTIAAGNGDVGITSRGEFDVTSTAYANEKVYVARCAAYVNAGIPQKWANSGSGILLSDTLFGTVERSVSWGNGQLSDYENGGPVGIWAFDASKITLQYNESYSNKTGSTRDGAGFDLDSGVTNSVVQNNYSHDNDGAGYLLGQFNNQRAWGRNYVRYNISQNDGRRNAYGALTLTGAPGPYNLIVENNVFFVSPAAGATPSGIRAKWTGTGVHIRNNVIQTTGGVMLADVDNAARFAQFNGNAWWSTGGAFKIRWNGPTYNGLAAWQAAGAREVHNGVATGIEADPRLTDPGAAPTIGNPYKFALLTHYKPLAGSPLINAGLTLAAPFKSYTPAGLDFFSLPVEAINRDVGAIEA